MSEAGNVIDLSVNPQRYLSNVSRQLRSYPYWIIYRLVPRGDVLAKIPHCWRDISIGEVSAFDARNHGTFEQCWEAAVKAGAWFGVGIVLYPQHNLFVLDIDYRKAEKLIDFAKRMKQLHPTASDVSVSDNGWHGYYLGRRPQNTREKDELEFYFDHQFIAVTGKDMSPDDVIADGTPLLNRLYLDPPAPQIAYPVAYEEIEYSDSMELVAAASKFIKGGDLWALLDTPNPFDWSGTLSQILLAMVSARAKKIDVYNTLMASSFVQQSNPKGGEFRSSKLHRLMYGKHDEWLKTIQFAASKGRFADTTVARSLSIETGDSMKAIDPMAALQSPSVLAEQHGTLAPEIAMAMFDTHFYIVMQEGSQAVVHGRHGGMYNFNKFVEAHRHLKLWGKDKDDEPKPMPAAPVWLDRTNQRYLEVRYEPVGCNDITPDYIGGRIYNMWRGFGATKVPVSGSFAEECPMIWEYLCEVIASQRQPVVEYVIKWLGDAVQNPQRIDRRTAMVLYSENEGTGKTTFGDLAGRLFHETHRAIIRFDDIDSRFTSRLENKAILVCNEFFMPTANMRNQDAASVDKFKARIFDLIDYGKMTAERKGKDATEVNNFARVVLSSNKDSLLPQGSRARRMFFVKPSDCRIGQSDWWSRLYEAMDTELDKFFTLLSRIDLTRWTPQDSRPRTAEMNQQLESAVSGIGRYVVDLLDRGQLWWANNEAACTQGTDATRTGQYFFTSKAVRQALEYIAGHKIVITDTAFGIQIMNRFAISDQKVFKPSKDGEQALAVRGRFWPELTECRKTFERVWAGGAEIGWTNDLEKWEMFSHPNLERGK